VVWGYREDAMKWLLGILVLVNAVYLVSAVLFILNFLFPGENLKKAANQALFLGFCFSSGFIFFEARVHGFYLPVASLYQALFFFSWSMVFIYILLAWRIKLDTFGLVLVPLIFVMSLTALVFFRFPVAPIPYRGGQWFVLHILAAFFAYASFALSFVGALLYLVQNRALKLKRAGTLYHRLPSLEILEAVVYRTIVIGFPLLTGALASGFFWTKAVFGVYWHWDPKFVSSLVTWFVYLSIIYMHYVSAMRGRKVVMASVFAFCCVLITFLGFNSIEAGVHHSFLK
jgi:ABC-type uncharacterized transport system permease subunit